METASRMPAQQQPPHHRRLARSAWLLFCLVGAAGCAEDSQPEICDGSSELRGGLQVSGGGQQPMGDGLITELGSSYVYVTGECQYFAYGRTAEQPFVFAPTVTGTLDGELKRSFDAALTAAGGGCAADGSTLKVFADGSTRDVGCVGPDTNLESLLSGLLRAGSPLLGPVRLVAIETTVASDAITRVEWPLDVALQSVSVPESEADTVGLEQRGFLIENDPGLPELRALRSRARAGEFAEYAGQAPELLVDADSKTYLIVFRDVLPFEDALPF